MLALAKGKLIGGAQNEAVSNVEVSQPFFFARVASVAETSAVVKAERGVRLLVDGFRESVSRQKTESGGETFLHFSLQ
jgi:hypothetical protein